MTRDRPAGRPRPGAGRPGDDEASGRVAPRGDAAGVEREVEEAAREAQPGDLNAAPPSAAGRGLVRNSAVMAVGTVTSRVTGVLRDVAMTAALGFYLVSDAYSLGNTLPNIIYILVVGGALNAVFVPQLVRRMKDDPDGGAGYADRLLTLVGTVLLVLSIAAVLLAPWIVRIYATDAYSPEQLDLATAFARYCLPQIFFYGLYALLSQVLNARGRFGAPMFAPIVNNVVAIGTFLLFLGIAGPTAAADGALTPGETALLGVGTTLGVAAQALVLVPILWRSGYAYRPRFDWRGAGLGKAGNLASWTIGLVLVNQLAYVVITRLATLANVTASENDQIAAGLTTYQKAHLIFVLPHSVITVSIVTALLPALSRVAHSGRLRQVGLDVASAMRLVAAFVLPVGTILILTAPGLSVLLFGYGAATTAQAELLGAVVSVFMTGLLPFTLFYVLLRGFYALEDTRTPFWLTVVFNVVMLALSVPFFYAVRGSAQIGALALGYSLAYWIAFVVAWVVLSRRLGGLDSRRTVRSLVRMFLASALAFGVMFGTQALLVWSDLGPDGRLQILVNVVVVSAVGLAVYLAAAWSFRIDEVGQVVRMVGRRLSRRG
ncbi:MAG: murein biosynthesis integral membrane protein MurJ [Candidatus Nanopelagicales bacterium]